MRYFDSAKNRALWEKEIDALDAEREARKKNGYKPAAMDKSAVSKADINSRMAEGSSKTSEVKLKNGVRKINLAQLEEIVRIRKGLPVKTETKVHRRRAKELQLSKDKVMT
ncbi:MAG: hypothetical protein K5894_07455 [Lachnospiraceae bacterium]|nr:hypothetical protein [Lachnospiraceae bacterium]